MRNILVIYPHWPPSNLAGGHRPRLIANNLMEFGWHPIILTVDEKFYEEEPDHDLLKLIANDVEVVKSKAFPVMRPRLIGDIGLRAFPFLYHNALRISRERKIDFIWIPIPSFYTAILGRMLYRSTKIPYGIDYIDPWVRDISGRRDWRHILSLGLARILEPIALRKASMVSGVAENYYLPAIERNFKISGNYFVSHLKLNGTPLPLIHVAMPYGFDKSDHEVDLPDLNLPWNSGSEVRPIIYAGALLPNSIIFLRTMMASISGLRRDGIWPGDLQFYLIGIGTSNVLKVESMAKEFGLSDIFHHVVERKPYIWILNVLKRSHMNLVLGSTEKHYTASKIFQNVLSLRPLIGIFHSESTTVNILRSCMSMEYIVLFEENDGEDQLIQKWNNVWKRSVSNKLDWQPELAALDQFSAKNSASRLASGMEKVRNLWKT